MKQRAPALSNSPTFQQLWDALVLKLIETAQGHMLYKQGVRGSSPLPPIIASISVPNTTTDPKKGHCLSQNDGKVAQRHKLLPSHDLSYQYKEFEVMTLQDALVAYKTYARAEGGVTLRTSVICG